MGALAGSILPDAVTDAMGIVLYAMFAAIIIPPAKKDRGILLVVIAACALSLILSRIPSISSGFCVILCAVAAAALGAWLHPIREKEENA